ncbi:MAG: N-acetyl-lysine deacetylase [Nitrososphaerota archaeon]|nr:N-acetyl-lysine deacetylase [Nitrososphaerota archaeon]
MSLLNDRMKVGKLLLSLIEVYTPPGGEAKLHSTLFKLTRGLGLRDTYVDDVGNFFVSCGRGSTKIMLASHLDTVPGKIEAFFDGEYVYGRGAVDAKGPFLSFLLAASEVAESISGVEVQVAGLVQEELDGLGAKHLVDEGFRADHVLVGEPTSLSIAIAYRGSITVEVWARTRGGHSSAPYIGESALDRILAFILEVRENFGGSSYEEATSAVTTLNAGDWPGRLPEKARAHVNIRFPKSYEAESAMKTLLEIAKKHGVQLKVIDSTPPVESRLDSKIVRAMMKGCLKNGLKPKIVKKTGTSDMNTLAKLTNSIAAFGPGDSRLAHTRDERISVDDLIKASKIISTALLELAKLP